MTSSSFIFHPSSFKKSSWPEDVTHGVELLAWMVARSHLKVRVAFRVHGESGRPLDFTATEDGYVHEKWAIFTDSEGNRLKITRYRLKQIK